MIAVLDDMIDFENDGINEDDNFYMADCLRLRKPHKIITNDFYDSIPPRNPETDILFVSYPANA